MMDSHLDHRKLPGAASALANYQGRPMHLICLLLPHVKRTEDSEDGFLLPRVFKCGRSSSIEVGALKS
jgi:hypothetical protein